MNPGQHSLMRGMHSCPLFQHRLHRFFERSQNEPAPLRGEAQHSLFELHEPSVLQSGKQPPFLQTSGSPQKLVAQHRPVAQLESSPRHCAPASTELLPQPPSKHTLFTQQPGHVALEHSCVPEQAWRKSTARANHSGLRSGVVDGRIDGLATNPRNGP